MAGKFIGAVELRGVAPNVIDGAIFGLHWSTNKLHIVAAR
jgi:hypothetical protein